MTKLIALEIDASTGEVIERDFTPEEIAQRDSEAQIEQQKLEAKEAAKASAVAKLAALGLTEEEIAAL
jgi:hypothetical protein